MNYREAKKIKVGDIVLTTFGERRRVINVNEDVLQCVKSILFTLDDGQHYVHTGIKEIESEDFVPSKYYQILAFNPRDKIDDVCSTHIYPTYVSCMSVKYHMARPCCFDDMCTHPTMLQSNPYDGLKFIDHYNARKMLEIVQQRFQEKEFHIIEVDALCFGRTKHRWVVSL